MRLALQCFVVVMIAVSSFATGPLVVERYAGSGSAAHADGPARTAAFSFPIGITEDRSANLFVVDAGNQVIRKITPAGDVSTVAGTAGVPGYRDGSAQQAQFNGPNGIVADSTGNLFVTDNSNFVVRKVAPTGEVSTFAGRGGVSGSADGSGANARFSNMHGIAIDAADNLYVADVVNHTIRKITPDGNVSTIAGRAGARGDTDGNASTARLNFPSAVAVDASGNVWIGGNNVIRRVSSDGSVTTVAGSPGVEGTSDGVGAAARFASVEGLAFDVEGNLYIADAGNHVIRVMDSSFRVTTVAGASGSPALIDGTGTAARFFAPLGIAASRHGRLFISDTRNNVIRVAAEISAMPSIELSGVSSGATIPNGMPLRIRTGNFVLSCDEGASSSTGRWQLLIDGVVVSTGCSETKILPSMAAGAHEITFQLLGADGNRLVPEVRRTLQVVVTPDPEFFFAQLVPGQARVRGAAGSFFRSTVWLVNRSDGISTLRMQFHPASGFSDSSTVNPLTVSVPPRQMIVIDDVLADAFAGTTDTAGSVSISPGSMATPPLVTARTFNDTPDGTFGQYIAGSSRSSTGVQWLEGLAADGQSRTNVGIVNFGSEAMDATVTLISPSGAQLGTQVTTTVPPRSFTQLNRVNVGAGVSESSLFAARIEATKPFDAYASRLDNVTSDPIFITTLTSDSEQWIDGVGSTPGAGGTFFRSLLVLANRDADAASVRIIYTERGATLPAAEETLVVAPHSSVSYADVVSDLFGRTQSAGWLSIRSTRPVTAWARTYNDRGVAGTFGQFIPAFSRRDLFDASGAVLPGVSENVNFRTNFGAINVGASAAELQVTAVASDGTIAGSKRYRLEAGQAIFVSRVLADIGAIGGGDMYLDLVPSQSGAIYAWASYVDNRSTDQTFVRPVR